MMGQIKIIVVTKSEKNQISNFQEKQNNEMHLEKSKRFVQHKWFLEIVR